MISIAGCSRADRSSPEPADSTELSSPLAAVVRVVVDGEEAGEIPARELVGRRPLAEVLPEGMREPGRWRRIEARSEDGRKLVLGDIGEAHAMLYFDMEAGPSLGLFRTASRRPHPLDTPLRSLTGAAIIEVHTGEREAPSASLIVRADDGAERHLSERELKEVARVELPAKIRGAEPRSGWSVAELAKLAAPGAVVTRVIGEDDHGKTLALDGPWDAPGRQVIVRRNKRGALDIAVWESGGGEPRQRLRALKRLTFVTQPSG